MPPPEIDVNAFGGGVRLVVAIPHDTYLTQAAIDHIAQGDTIDIDGVRIRIDTLETFGRAVRTS